MTTAKIFALILQPPGSVTPSDPPVQIIILYKLLIHIGDPEMLHK